MEWHRLRCSSRQLCLANVLRCGQSFRWRQVNGVFSIALKSRILFVCQDERYLYYRSVAQAKCALSDEELVMDYFNLNVDLEKLYETWSKDRRFKIKHRGVRILRQDPWETVCSFICSSNNNIKRISQMVDKLCREFGTFLGTIDGLEYYDFPDPDALTGPDVEQRLRALGFGYRARYLSETANLVANMVDPRAYLLSLREAPYEEARDALLKLRGVGPKVADCICLMSLDKHDCIPVDTHVWRIAERDYAIRVKQTTKGYNTVQSCLKKVWGPYAGWAHCVLFAGDLSNLDNGINIEKPSGAGNLELKIKVEMVEEPLIKIET